LVESIKAKVSEESVTAVETLDGLPAKTKGLSEFLKKIQVSGGALLVVDRPSASLARIARNLRKVDVKQVCDLNSYDLLVHPRIVFTRQGWKQIQEKVAG
jgi:ribosomal protein L4